ncbi:MAG TPA: sodium:solute symporter family protein [Arachidicoccus sp.]
MKLHLNLADYLVILTYFCFVIGIGFFLKRRMKTSHDFLLSSRSIPMWIASLAFISANLGAQEVLGMSASGAKYGLYTNHFYWLGAVLAMLFLGVFMMPFYYGSKARSVPEYLALRFDEKTRGLNAITFAIMTVFSSGISLYALAILLESMLGIGFNTSILIASVIVLAYTYLGGLTSAVYNEVLQFFLIVLGIAPLVYIGLHHVGGWEGVKANLGETNLLHVWKGMGSDKTNPMGTNYRSLIFGLGFVLAFGYWCTDFLVVQRAMVTRNLNDAQMTPIYASIPKIFMPVIVILPGIIALALMKGNYGYSIPLTKDGHGFDYNMTLPSMLQHFYPNGLLGVGLTALIASFMSGMAGNVTAFNTVFTFDIYQAYIHKNGSDEHYLKVGKFVTVFGILASVGTAYLAKGFDNIMDFLQLVFGFINAPLFATFFLGMFWKKTTANGAFFGLISGMLAAAATYGLTIAEGKGGWLAHSLNINPIEISSSMGQNFDIASFAFIACFVVTWVVSLFTKRKDENTLVGLVYSMTPKTKAGHNTWYKNPIIMGCLVLLITVIFNIIFY